MVPRLTYGKSDKLKKRKEITALFEKGQSMQKNPIRMIYREIPDPEMDVQLKTAVTVPSRNFRKATQRNLLKRRMREAFRITQFSLRDKTTRKFHLMLIYTAREITDYQTISNAIQHLLSKLGEKMT